jgi:hypothetical protein
VRQLRFCVPIDLPCLRETPQLNLTAFAPLQMKAGGAVKNRNWSRAERRSDAFRLARLATRRPLSYGLDG